MCDDLWILFTSFGWHCTHVSVTPAVFSCALSAFGACTLWQVRHDMLRESCFPPDQSVWPLRLWQDRQTSLASRGDNVFGFLILVLSPSASTCAWPGP